MDPALSSDNVVKCRSSSVKKTLIDETYVEVTEYTVKSKLPDGKLVIGRMMALCQTGKGTKTVSRYVASRIVATEIIDDWIDKNVYPANERAVAKKIKADYELFKELLKTSRRTTKKKTESWTQKAQDFNSRMVTRAYDIRTKDATYEKKLESKYEVVMTPEDIAFYEDNCKGAYVATCSRTVPSNWSKQKKRKEKRRQSELEKKHEQELHLKEEAMVKQSQIEESMKATNELSDLEHYDPSFSTPHSSKPSTHQTQSERKTRSTSKQGSCSKDTEQARYYPRVKIRTGRRTLNEALMRCLVQCLSEYKVTTEDLRGIVLKVGNIVFQQDWLESDESEEDPPTQESEDSEEENTDTTQNQKKFTIKRKRKSNDLTYVMPSRQCINKWLEDAAFLNLELVANTLLNKEDSVITVGLDDTTKAAGHRLYDVKSDHITIAGPSHERKSLTTGYSENVSHSGKDGAETYQFKLKCLAILSNSTVDELKEQIDFWISDRAKDCAVLFEHLGVDEEHILKCCAHVTLGIDHAIDKVFREVEQQIGIQHLINGDKVLLNSSSSIHTLGLIAITKLLSPSHASHSVSLYNEFVSWMEANNINHGGFKGFVSNRFGRIVELAKEYLRRREAIQSFFESVVDVNANKLVLAVSIFVDNEWFQCCAEVYSLMGELLIFPILRLLGIDQNKEVKNDQRNWAGVKEFFTTNILKLEKLQVKFAETSTGKGKLIGRVLEEILDTIKRQLSEMSYFGMEGSTSEKIPDEEKLHYAPLTNLGCESEFAKLDNKIKASGGMTSINTHSKKNIVATNGLLVDSKFVETSEAEKLSKWKWARSSEEVLQVKKLEKDMLQTVKETKKLSLLRKEELKKKKSEKTTMILEKCKEHGGPCTPNSISALDELSEKQLLAEITYLRNTIAPDITQKRRIKVDGKFKFQNFSLPELRQSIKSVIKPEGCVENSVEDLLKNAFDSRS